MVNTSDLAKTHHTSQRSNGNLEIVASRLLKQNKTHGNGMFYTPQATRDCIGASKETSGYRKRSESSARSRDRLSYMPLITLPLSLYRRLSASPQPTRFLNRWTVHSTPTYTEHHLTYISLTYAVVPLSQHKRIHPRNMLPFFTLPYSNLFIASPFDFTLSLFIHHPPSIYSRPYRTHERVMAAAPEHSGSETDLVLVWIPFKYEGLERICTIRERGGDEMGDEGRMGARGPLFLPPALERFISSGRYGGEEGHYNQITTTGSQYQIGDRKVDPLQDLVVNHFVTSASQRQPGYLTGTVSITILTSTSATTAIHPWISMSSEPLSSGMDDRSTFLLTKPPSFLS
jgi:hypothetical protein